MDAVAQGDESVFGSAIDPEVYWVIADPVNDPVGLTGTYVRPFSLLQNSVLREAKNLQEWVEKVRIPLASRLQGAVSMNIDSLDVVGQKAIVEITASGLQKNGKPYNNRCVSLWVGKGCAES